MTLGRAVMVELIACYLRGLLDPFMTLLEVQKLMYFVQMCMGLPVTQATALTA